MKIFILTSMIFTLFSCNRSTIWEKQIKANLNKEINVRTVDNIINKNKEITFDDFRNIYKYIYVVYLKEGCMPCYPKYVEWQEKMDSINIFNDVTVLFVIKGNSYDTFVEEAMKEGLKEDKFYAFMDPDDSFINTNKGIPGWIIENTFLIDNQNRIVLIGSPFSTPEMTKVFYDICSEKQGSYLTK